MKEHYNLYYIFLEDKLKNSMPEEYGEKYFKNFRKNKTDSSFDTPLMMKGNKELKEKTKRWS